MSISDKSKFHLHQVNHFVHMDLRISILHKIVYDYLSYGSLL